MAKQRGRASSGRQQRGQTEAAAPSQVPPDDDVAIRRRRGQRVLPGLDVEGVRGFLDLSSGMPTTVRCPRCGYEY